METKGSFITKAINF